MADANSRITPFIKQCFVTCAVCLNVVGHGCVIGFPAVLLPQLRARKSALAVTANMESWIASIMAISMFFGNFLTSPVMSRAGRKWAHYAVTLPVMLGWLCVMLATRAEALLVGRVLHGFSVGMLMPLRSVLVGEYTSPRARGGFLTTIALAQAFGILFVHLLGSVASFQLTALVSMLFSFVSLLMTIYSPESPSWLATQGKYDECRKVFIWLRGPEEIPELEKMIKASQVAATKPSQKQNRFKDTMDVIKKKEFYKPVVLMLTLYFIMQFAGGTLMAAYSTTVITLLLGPGVDAHFWMVALDVQRIFFNVVAVYVINRTRRRTMLFATGALCAGSLLAMAGYVFAKIKGVLPFESLWIPGILLNLQVVSVAMGMVPLPGVIAGEVFPLHYRSAAGSISLISLSLSLFLVLKTFPALVAAAGLHGTYALHAGVLAAGLAAAARLLPETRGRTLQQVEESFRGAPLHARNKETQPLNGTEQKPSV